jgi:hypothetical protein
MNELISLLAVIPYGLEVMTGIGTLTAVCTILHPVAKVIVNATPWSWDNNALTKASRTFKAINKFTGIFKRFSLIK